MAETKRNHTARCRRCGAVLYRYRRDGIDRAIAFSLAGVVLFVIANSFPLMSFTLEGRSNASTLITGVLAFWDSGFWELAGLVLGASILVPLASFATMLYVLVPLRLGKRPKGLGTAFRLAKQLRPWAMMEVFMLGVFVAIVKLADFAEVEPGVSLYALGALIVVTAAAAASLDARIVWERAETVT